MAGIRLQPQQRRAIFKTLDGFVKRYGPAVALHGMRKYLAVAQERERAQRAIAVAEKQLAELRRKVGG